MVLVIMLVLQAALPTLLSLVAETSKYAAVLENNFRLGLGADRVVLDAYVDHIARQDGYKIAFIGDSVVQGAAVKDDSKTIPAYFMKEIQSRYPSKDIRVYNLGMQGNRPSDVYYMLKKLTSSQAVDFVIMNINFAFYSAKMLEEHTIARPELYSDLIGRQAAGKLGIEYSPLESFAVRQIADRWNLYRFREEFSYYLFGGNPRVKLTNAIQSLAGRTENSGEPQASTAVPEKEPTWRDQIPFPEEKITHWVDVLNVDRLDENNVSYWFLKKTMQEVKQSGIKMAAFLTPINGGMLESLDLMRDAENFDFNIGKLKADFREAGIGLADYTQRIAPDEFFDLFHMISSGNARVAELLANDFGAAIEKEEVQ